MTSPARPATEVIPLLDLRAQYESIAPEIHVAVDEVLRSQQFILGPQGEALEREIAKLCGVRHAIGVASGTDALYLAMHVCGVGIGDEVAVSFRVAGEERDATDDRPLQTRRYFTVGRYSAVVTVRDGRVARVQEYPHLAAALEALGIDEEA